nr:NAD(P)H-binding protein [Kofleriaceae bacterium]
MAGGQAFVLGATGFVGREVVRQLAVRGGTPIAHVRPESVDTWRPKLAALGAEVVATTWEVGELAAALRSAAPAQLYVLIGTTRSRAKADGVDGDIYERIDFGLTRLAVDAARASEVRPRICYLSSVGADAGARGAYLKARGKAEDAVRGSGLPWVIARPSIITGDRDDSRTGERTAAVVGDGLLAVAGVLGGKGLRDRYRSTTPDVLASALIRLAEGADHDRVYDGSALR